MFIKFAWFIPAFIFALSSIIMFIIAMVFNGQVAFVVSIIQMIIAGAYAIKAMDFYDDCVNGRFI